MKPVSVHPQSYPQATGVTRKTAAAESLTGKAVICLLCCWLLVPPALSAPPLTQLQAQARQGDPWAQLNLGAAYDHGLSGLAADPAEAVRWYRQAAEQGLDKAQFNLAHCLATGHGVPQDYAEARLWMRRAAQQGMADAQFLMGVMLLEGLGGRSAVDEGRAWLQRAAMGGNVDAVDYLKNLR